MNEHIRQPRGSSLPASCPPRGLRREAAADYLGVSIEMFDVLRRRGQIEAPCDIDGDKIWDRQTIRVGDHFEYQIEVIRGVYVVRFAGFLKIGISTNIYRRIVTLEENLPEYLTIIKLLPGDRRLEERLLRRFASERRKGEWFEIGPMLTAWIADGCRP